MPKPAQAISLAATPGRWLAVIIVILIGLTWLNYAYCQHRIAVLGFPLSTRTGGDWNHPQLSQYDIERLKRNLGMHSKFDDMRQEHRWMIGREIALMLVAIGGVWALYSFSRKRQLTAP